MTKKYIIAGIDIRNNDFFEGIEMQQYFSDVFETEQEALTYAIENKFTYQFVILPIYNYPI